MMSVRERKKRTVWRVGTKVDVSTNQPAEQRPSKFGPTQAKMAPPSNRGPFGFGLCRSRGVDGVFRNPEGK